MWKSRIDSEVKVFYQWKKQFAPWTFFLGGGRKGAGGGCFISLSLVGNKEGIIKKL